MNAIGDEFCDPKNVMIIPFTNYKRIIAICALNPEQQGELSKFINISYE